MPFLCSNTNKNATNAPPHPGDRVGETLARSTQKGTPNTPGWTLRNNSTKNPLQKLSRQTLKNRIIMGSMHTGLEEAHGGRLTKMAAFYAARAKGGASLMVTGGISPNREGWVAPFAAKLTNAEEMEKHKEVTDAVHAYAGSNVRVKTSTLDRSLLLSGWGRGSGPMMVLFRAASHFSGRAPILINKV